MVFGTKEFDEFNGSGLNTKMNIQIATRTSYQNYQ
jgi:hypothetical protein